jgi:hypothetical protein
MTTRTQLAVGKKRKAIRLASEAFKMVEENANSIAKWLLDSTEKGHVMSARLLVELAEGDVEVEESSTRKPPRSLALRLADEPQAANATPQKSDEN